MLRGTNVADEKVGVDVKVANARTYIISNPWNYYYTDVPILGYLDLRYKVILILKDYVYLIY
ncbi:hypothetical protein FSB73_22340 [Arachidicoccus ginsenosidivorans]|uniref:Uncharacterized protein n=1 Tax=Arachidicoccus ginsenosidivorans TaxID=496057 RepID=A0A5B8VV00_9BACT|nr:hypothetical protein [Arachidicoccus ginsenosidivorans]QEC73998.1 hypothetical protein FSB73_22340 [Arachidicoccus ginsenosidivorans]